MGKGRHISTKPGLPLSALTFFILLAISSPASGQEESERTTGDVSSSEETSDEESGADEAPDTADLQPVDGEDSDGVGLSPDTIGDALTAAKESYITSDYPRVVTLLQPHLSSDHFEALNKAEQVDVLRLLGLAYISLDSPREEEARLSFLKILIIQPDFVFTEGLVPPVAIELLEALREEMADTGLVDEAAAGIATVYIQKELRQQNFMLVFMPLGVGQFQNGDAAKGTFFLIMESLGLGINIFSYSFIELELRGSDGFFTPENKEVAEGFRLAQFVSLGFFAMMYGISVWDAWANYEGTTTEFRTLDRPPDELTQRDQDTPLERGGLRDRSFRAVPSEPLALEDSPLDGMPMLLEFFRMDWRF